MNSSPTLPTHWHTVLYRGLSFLWIQNHFNETCTAGFSCEVDSLQRKKEVEFWRVRAGIWVTASVSTLFSFKKSQERNESTTPLFLSRLIKWFFFHFTDLNLSYIHKVKIKITAIFLIAILVFSLLLSLWSPSRDSFPGKDFAK